MTISKILSDLSRWPLFGLYFLFLYYVHTLPSDQIPPAVALANDKLLHLISFFLLTLLGIRTFLFSSRGFFRFHAEGKAALLSVFYGAFLEGVQATVPGRQSSFADWLADAVGVLAVPVILRISKLTHPA